MTLGILSYNMNGVSVKRGMELDVRFMTWEHGPVKLYVKRIAVAQEIHKTLNVTKF
jgi:hypothetical protein